MDAKNIQEQLTAMMGGFKKQLESFDFGDVLIDRDKVDFILKENNRAVVVTKSGNRAKVSEMSFDKVRTLFNG